MPSVFFAGYTPVIDSVPAIREQEHLLGRMLLDFGLRTLYGLTLSAEEFSRQILPELPPLKLHLLQIQDPRKLPSDPDISLTVPEAPAPFDPAAKKNTDSQSVSGQPSSGKKDTQKVSLGNQNGKPFVTGRPDIHFNISHCKGLAVCAFHTAPIGADAELPGYFADILVRRTLSETEKHFFLQQAVDDVRKQEWFFRFWTLKEAYVKCSGKGVDTDLTAFTFSFPETFLQPSCREFPTGVIQVNCSDRTVCCLQTTISHGQILSLCFK